MLDKGGGIWCSGSSAEFKVQNKEPAVEGEDCAGGRGIGGRVGSERGGFEESKESGSESEREVVWFKAGC